MTIIVEIIINAIIRAIVNAIIYSIAFAVNRAIAGAVSNGIEKGIRSKVLSKLDNMSDSEKARYVRENISVVVRRVGFGKYFVAFEEHLFGIYSFGRVCYKKEVLKDIAFDIEAKTDKMVEKLAAKNKIKKLKKEEVLEMEEVLNTFYTMSHNLISSYAHSTGRVINNGGYVLDLQHELANIKTNNLELLK